VTQGRGRIGVAALAVAIACACLAAALPAGARAATPLAASTLSPLSLSQVTTWAYQIQGLERAGAVDALAAAPYDMLVLEPTRTERGSGSFDTAGMVARLHDSFAGDATHGKLVLAYLSVGEAESWRWYWTWTRTWRSGAPRPRDWPRFIVAKDPDGWGGCYPVAYWRARWKDIAIYGRRTDTTATRDYTSIVDEAIRDGFDGVYLDWVEAYELRAVRRAAAADGVNARDEMVAFLTELRDYARQRDPDFVVVQQNASSLAVGRPQLFSVVDGIAQEGIWYYGDATDSWTDPRGHDVATPASWRADYLTDLTLFTQAGLPVFDCDYAVAHAATVYARAAARGFVAYCTRAALSRLTTTPPPAR
jgi:cysteinyl-tRNA synthetase